MSDHRYIWMFIDDERNPISKYDIIVRSSNEAIDWMEKNGCPDFISFDHDLGGDDTAMNVVNWMIEKDLDSSGSFIPKEFQFAVHSANPVGAKNIEMKLQKYLEDRNDV